MCEHFFFFTRCCFHQQMALRFINPATKRRKLAFSNKIIKENKINSLTWQAVLSRIFCVEQEMKAFAEVDILFAEHLLVCVWWLSLMCPCV